MLKKTKGRLIEKKGRGGKACWEKQKGGRVCCKKQKGREAMLRKKTKEMEGILNKNQKGGRACWRKKQREGRVYLAKPCLKQQKGRGYVVKEGEGGHVERKKQRRVRVSWIKPKGREAMLKNTKQREGILFLYQRHAFLPFRIAYISYLFCINGCLEGGSFIFCHVHLPNQCIGTKYFYTVPLLNESSARWCSGQINMTENGN